MSGCSFTVTVNDTEKPVATAPKGTTHSANASRQAAISNIFLGVAATDNCTPTGSLLNTKNPEAGIMVGLGTHTISVTVEDTAGSAGDYSFTAEDDTALVVCQNLTPKVQAESVAADVKRRIPWPRSSSVSLPRRLPALVRLLKRSCPSPV